MGAVAASNARGSAVVSSSTCVATEGAASHAITATSPTSTKQNVPTIAGVGSPDFRASHAPAPCRNSPSSAPAKTSSKTWTTAPSTHSPSAMAATAASTAMDRADRSCAPGDSSVTRELMHRACRSVHARRPPTTCESWRTKHGRRDGRGRGSNGGHDTEAHREDAERSMRSTRPSRPTFMFGLWRSFVTSAPFEAPGAISPSQRRANARWRSASSRRRRRC